MDIEGTEFDVLLNTKPSIGFGFLEVEKSNVYTPTLNIKGNTF